MERKNNGIFNTINISNITNGNEYNESQMNNKKKLINWLYIQNIIDHYHIHIVLKMLIIQKRKNMKIYLVKNQ